MLIAPPATFVVAILWATNYSSVSPANLSLTNYSSASAFCQAKARKHMPFSQNQKSAQRQIFDPFLKFVISIHICLQFCRDD